MATTYHLNAWHVRLSRWLGYCFLIATAVYVGFFLYEPETMRLMLLIVALPFFGTLAFVALRIGWRPERYTVEISDDGIGRPSSGMWLPWSRIVRLRERPHLQRVDLVGPASPTGISIEYQLDDFAEALTLVLDSIRSESPTLGLFRRRRGLALGIGIAVAICVVGVAGWGWLTEAAWEGLPLILLFVGVYAYDYLTEVNQVAVANGSVTVQRGPRKARYLLERIAAVSLALRPIGHGNRYLDVFISVDGRDVPIRPRGVDPFQMYDSLRVVVEAAQGQSGSGSVPRAEAES